MPFYILGHMRTRATCYLDSRNLHHYFQSFGVDSHNYDYKALAVAVTTSDGKFPKDTIIKMYGARFPAEKDIHKHNRDDAFYKHLEKSGIKVCLGQFKFSDGAPVEKGVDVRLASDLILDSVFGSTDQLYIFSSDTDLLPAIEGIKRFPKVKPFVLLNACHMHLADEFKKVGCHVLMLSEKLVKKFVAQNSVQPTSETLSDLANKFNKK